MRVLLILMICLFGLLACTSSSILSAKDCVENEEFKKAFFSSIEYIDYVHNYNHEQLDGLDFDSIKVIIEKQNEKYNSSLSFIGHYAHVSWEKRMNYDNSYPNDADYQQDKAGWLKWYEENKCSNIQFKKQ